MLFSDKFRQFFEFFVPQVQFFRQNGGHSCCAGFHSFLRILGAVLGQGRCARDAQRQGYGQTVQNSVLVPQLPFFADRRHPFRAAESVSHGLVWSEDHRAPQLQYVARWSMPLLRMSCLTCPSLCNDRTSGLSLYSALSLVQQRIHALRQPTELLKKPTQVLREGGLWYKVSIFRQWIQALRQSTKLLKTLTFIPRGELGSHIST